MGSFIDLTGQKFNRLSVIEKTDMRKNNSVVWECQCDCGNICYISSIDLRKSRVKSCGCLKKEKDQLPKGNVKDLLGQKFGKLTIIARDGSDKRGEAKWLCQCECGSQPISVLGSNLRSGHTQSCGCDRRSHGELKVEQLLRENNISFIQEYKPFKFDSGKWAAFDFYVENKYLIEYDGETHYKFNLHGWHDEQQLANQQERDQIKNDFCLSHNLPLIRIPYWHLPKLCIEDLQLETSQFLIKYNE